MLIIPAIDLKDGRCVRLQQGDMSKVTVFGDDPVAMAKHWSAQGARRLHIVDLNGAVAGMLAALPIVDLTVEEPPLEDVMRQLFATPRAGETAAAAG